MPLPPYGETKDVPGTPAWREKHPVGDWFKNAKYNAAYDPMHFGDSNHGIPYQSPSTSYQQPLSQNLTLPAADQSGVGNLPPQYFEGPNNQGMVNGVPTWNPPAQVPQQNQNNLFNQNPNSSTSIPSWQPPTSLAPPQPNLGTMQNPALGTSPRRYQSPSTRYLRNQRTF